MRRLKSGIVIALVLIFMFCSVSFAWASGIDQKKGELTKVKGNISDTKEQLDDVKDQQKELASQLESIQKDLSAKENELNKTEIKLADTQEKLSQTQVQLKEAIHKVEEQKMLMGERLRVIYMNGKASYLELLFEAKSLNDLLDRLFMIQQLMDFDSNVLKNMQGYKDEVIKKEAQLKEQEEEISDVKSQIVSQKQVIESKKHDKQKLLDKLKAEQGKYEKELDELEKTSKELEVTIQKLAKEMEEKRKQELERKRKEDQKSKEQQKKPSQTGNRGSNDSSGRYTGGTFAWPAPSSYGITSSYGYRIHPIFHTKRLHTGVDIGAASGTPIVAADDGIVILARYNGGYGNCVIISHGGGITTLYGHASKLLVKAGQYVSRGQAIARVGSTGNSTGPHLHFEVRKNGSPVNPMNYLR